MNIVSIEQVNKAVIDLVEAKSDKLLNQQIVEAAKTFMDADYGKLYLYNKDHLKRVYYCCDEVKQNTLLDSKSFIKLLNKQTVFTITNQEIKKMQVKNFPSRIKFLIIVPLIHAQQP